MTDKPKIRTIGAKKATNPLTVETLMVFAERLIRSDRDAAMRSQQGVEDLVAPSNDGREESSVQASSLEKLCGKRGAVSVKRSNDSQPNNVVAFPPKKKSE